MKCLHVFGHGALLLLFLQFFLLIQIRRSRVLLLLFRRNRSIIIRSLLIFLRLFYDFLLMVCVIRLTPRWAGISLQMLLCFIQFGFQLYNFFFCELQFRQHFVHFYILYAIFFYIILRIKYIGVYYTI